MNNSLFEVFWRFLWLGCVSFGGPAAHTAIFRRYFVSERQWLAQQDFAERLALCQFLPGPTSSQLGFAIGYQRAGLAGACAAFLGFTFPSFVLLTTLALLGRYLPEGPYVQAALHLVKIFAFAIVADATWSLGRQFCQQRWQQSLALLALLVLWWFPSSYSQIALVIGSALVGIIISKTDNTQTRGAPLATTPLILFLLLLLCLPWFSDWHPLTQLANAFYQAGSWVFGGGHVVLPLLQQQLAEQYSQQQLLGAYSAAQLVPGPMFTMASFLGAQTTETPILGALIATLMIFLPGFLLLLAILPYWPQWRCQPQVQAALSAVNAAVVGFLLATLIQPIALSAITNWWDASIALIACAWITIWRLPIWGLLLGLLILTMFYG